MYWKLWIGLLSFGCVIAQGICQYAAENSPPSMWGDRSWHISDDEPIGSKIAQYHGSDQENDLLTFGLEPYPNFGSDEIPDPLPFKINAQTGAVYLNDSLQNRTGESFLVYVTLTDGHITVKNEALVKIFNSSNLLEPPINGPPFPPGGFNIFGSGAFGRVPPKKPPSPPRDMPPMNVGTYNPPPNISNNPAIMGTNPYFKPKKPKNSTSVTHLRPVKVEQEEEEVKKVVEVEINEIPVDEKEELKKASLDVPVKHPELASTLVSIISIVCVFLTVGIISIIFRKKIYFNKKKEKDDMTKDPVDGIRYDNNNISMDDGCREPRAISNGYTSSPHGRGNTVNSSESELPEENDPWEFPRHRLKFFNILGEGAFGQVWKCEAMDLDGRGPSIVAVKTLKENANEKEKSDLVSELKVMKFLDPHPNVVKLLACCTDKEPIFLIMEYITEGKLQSYLRNSRAERYYNNMHGKSRSLTSRDLTMFCHQVAKGMDFLSTNGIIHRDLAARNILITEDHTCKVADFGFARDVVSSHVYERKSEGRLPIRWMAPESLYDNIFSVKSDVWSFGVLIWEVVTLGSTPYPGMSAAEVMKKVRDGYRLDKPEHCRREIYNIMYYCWDKDPSQRPSFEECVRLLEQLIMTETDYIELERFPDHSYYNMMSLSGEKL